MTRLTRTQACKLADRLWRAWAYHHCELSFASLRVMRDCATLSPTRAGRCYAAILNSLSL